MLEKKFPTIRHVAHFDPRWDPEIYEDSKDCEYYDGPCIYSHEDCKQCHLVVRSSDQVKT